MSILLDTSALIAARNADDKNHIKTLEIMALGHGNFTWNMKINE